MKNVTLKKDRIESAVERRSVPLLDLSRQYAVIRHEVRDAVDRVCASQQFILGDEVSSFESQVAAFTGAAAAIACASGSDALWLSLQAAGVQPGDEVLTTSFSFIATASSIVRTGARPIFVDVDPETLNIDVELVKRKLSESHTGRRRAIVPAHLYGQCADMDGLCEMASAKEAIVVEDAAQAFGAAWRGKRAGSLGDIAALSFYPSKNFSAYGDGGCVTTSNADFAEKVRRLRNYGSRQRYHHDEDGWNSRLDAIQAAILKVKIKYIVGWNAERVKHAATYNRLFAEAGLTSYRPANTSLSSGPLKILHVSPEAYHIYHQYVICAQRRDALREFLIRHGIGTEIYYPVPLHLQKCYSYLGYGPGSLPHSERAAGEVLALPMFPELLEEEQRCVVETIAEFYS